MRNLKSLLYIVAAIFIVTLYSCGTKKTETIYIISTNDIHGAIGRVPNLATLVENYRAQDTASVFLLDAGDRWTGNVYVDRATEPGKPMVDLMNMLNYDVATFGNHEFDKGLAILDKRTREFSFPVVLANIYTGVTLLTQPEPYTILTSMGGKKLAVLGLVTNFVDGHPDGMDDVFEGTQFQSPFDTGKRYEWLKKENDILIGLTHIGDWADSTLAVTAPAFDLIIGGHTHTLMTEPRIYGNTYVTQAGGNLRYAGITKVTMSGKKIVSIDNKLVKLDTIPPNDSYAQLIEKYYDNQELKRPIGTFATAVDKEGVANLVTDLIRKELDTDFAFYHIGGIRIHHFEKGNVSTANIFDLEPFESKAVKVSMTLPQIKELIINKFNDTQNPRESHRADIYPAGMKYTIITDEEGEAVDVIFDHSYKQNKNATYSVAMADYMYNKYKFEKPVIEAESRLITDIFINHFKTASPVKPDNKPRVDIRQR